MSEPERRDVDLGDVERGVGAGHEAPCSDTPGVGAERGVPTDSTPSDCSTISTPPGHVTPIRGGPVSSPLRILWRNPELVKVILASGFQMAAADIAGTIDLGPDTNQTWQSRTSAYVATFALLANIASYITGPLVGHLMDTVDRRMVLIIYGLITFLPTFVYWPFPLDSSVVWASHVASVFGAIGRSSNIAYALSAQVTSFEDRSLGSGVYYGLTSLMTLVFSVLPSFLVEFGNPYGLTDLYNRHPRIVLYYQAVLVAAFILSALSIAKPAKKGRDGSEDGCVEYDNNANPICTDYCNNPVCTDYCNNADPLVTPERSSCCTCLWRRKCCRDWIDMVKLLNRHERLMRLCLAAFFLAIGRAISVGNDGQFFSQSLGYYKSEHTLDFDQMNVLRSLGKHLMVLPGFLLTGYFAMKTGTLKVLRRFVPVTALMVASGAFLTMLHRMWFVPIVVAVQTLGHLYQVPLMRMTFGVARPGRTGVWLTMVGMATEAGDMLGNLVIILLNSCLPDGAFLWIYYPAGGFVALAALIPLLGEPKTSIGWGMAAGSALDQFKATMRAKKVAREMIRQTIHSRKKFNSKRSDGQPTEHAWNSESSSSVAPPWDNADAEDSFATEEVERWSRAGESTSADSGLVFV